MFKNGPIFLSVYISKRNTHFLGCRHLLACEISIKWIHIPYILVSLMCPVLSKRPNMVWYLLSAGSTSTILVRRCARYLTLMFKMTRAISSDDRTTVLICIVMTQKRYHAIHWCSVVVGGFWPVSFIQGMSCAWDTWLTATNTTIA